MYVIVCMSLMLFNIVCISLFTKWTVLFSKQVIHSEPSYDFLRDLVASVPDVQPEEECEVSAWSVPDPVLSENVGRGRGSRGRSKPRGGTKARGGRLPKVDQHVESEVDYIVMLWY